MLLVPLATLAVLAGPSEAMAAPPGAKHAPTIDDVMRMRMLVGVEPHPKGTEAVIQVQDYDGGPKWKKDLWRVVPGHAPVRLTASGRNGGSFTYSPDGTRIAFVGERNGRPGIQVLPLAGGEATTILETPMGLDALRWAGTRIYFVAAVLPACGADLACTVRA